MRYTGLLLSLALFAGCMQATDKPVAQPTDVDHLPGSPQHSVNKPEMRGSQVDPDPNPGAQVKRPPDEAAPLPDNTAVNERDKSSAAKTPFDQGNNASDIKVTADIRQKIVNYKGANDAGLSINARNVKIITEDQRVTLRGPVANTEEKTLIEKFAKETAGAENVTSQLEIAP